MPSNTKYLCAECGWAAKGKCPQHPESCLKMGKKWRPGKRGRRTRLWDNRVHGSVTVSPMQSRWAWRSRPYAELPHPPRGLMVLGATDFSHDPTELAWNDPVRVAIRNRNSKPPRPLDPGPHHDDDNPGWPFPYRL